MRQEPAPFSRPFIVVIAGINTDVEFNGTVYHVQTEDKGAPAHQIMSLVYNKGTILASKRVSYDDLASVDFNETQIAKRVSRQHRLICAAVSAGRIAELKEMAAQKRVSGAKSNAPQAVVAEAGASVLPVAAPAHIAATESVPAITALAIDHFADAPVIEAIGIIEDEILLSEDAVAIVSELAGRERRPHNKLSVELLGEAKFKGGDRKTLNIMICRGTARKVVTNAEIMIKVVGSSFRPVIFHARSDANGLATMNIEIPPFQAGRAALLIRVLHDGEEVELRRLVTAE